MLAIPDLRTPPWWRVPLTVGSLRWRIVAWPVPSSPEVGVTGDDDQEDCGADEHNAEHMRGAKSAGKVGKQKGCSLSTAGPRSAVCGGFRTAKVSGAGCSAAEGDSAVAMD